MRQGCLMSGSRPFKRSLTNPKTPQHNPLPQPTLTSALPGQHPATIHHPEPKRLQTGPASSQTAGAALQEMMQPGKLEREAPAGPMEREGEPAPKGEKGQGKGKGVE